VAASAERIEEVLSRLTACQREVITRHLRGMTQREIAAELGQPLSTVKSAEARAKLNLRRELAELLDRCPRLG
jgi:RNA polymerase sigma factor (sigma-70 family)